mmetsp:Transcript_9263/g.33956  ORF Transcript_9263/g.33956 Transcript_9263/m.33956 type:complete len:548 (+) Transcript_9263:161-1804(+)
MRLNQGTEGRNKLAELLHAEQQSQPVRADRGGESAAANSTTAPAASAARCVVVIDEGEFQGHLIPALELVRMLCARGHRVHFFAAEGVRERVEATGAIFQPYDLGIDSSDEGACWSSRKEAVRQLQSMGYQAPPEMYDHPFLAQLPASLGLLERGLATRVRELQPALIIADMGHPWGPMVAEVLGLPLVTLMSCTYAPRKQLIEAFGLQEWMEEASQQDYMQAVCQRLRSRFGLTYEPLHIYDHLSEFQICNTMPEFDQAAARAIKQSPLIKCYGPSFPPLIGEGTEVMPDEDLQGFPLESLRAAKQEGRKIVYFSMGTVAGQYKFANSIVPAVQAAVEALGPQPQLLVVLSVGPRMNMEELPTMPSNFMVRRSVPQKSVLGLADVFITHMGSNSVNEGIFMGCPMVAIPNFSDQNTNAARATELGIAVNIPSPCAPLPVKDLTHVTAERLGEAVEQVLSEPRFKNACLQLSHRARQRRRYFDLEAANEIFAYADQWHKKRHCAAVPDGSNNVGLSGQGISCTPANQPGSAAAGAHAAATFTRIASH